MAARWRAGLLALLLASCATTPSAPREPPLPPGQTIRVQPGQTLSQIARETGCSIEELVEVNGLRSPDDLRAGQLLFVPAMTVPGPSTGPTPPTPKPPTSPRPPSTRPPSTTPKPLSSPDALLAWPLDGLVLRDFAGPKAKTGAYDGILIAAPAKTAVQAAAPGKVAFVGSQDTALGLFVIVEHKDDLVTIYAHLHDAKVKAGDAVAVGDVVGTVGTSGLVGVSPRMQFQVRRQQVAVDPLPLLPP
ncbi:MAG TPA: LysM peptidoglycan-binding domain-containing M23 family metallopeptidase [Myxococcota bacterium]